MKARRTLISLVVALVAVLVVAGTLLFTRFVQDSLWDKSVTDVLEVTAQGQHALSTYFEKDLDTLDLFADELAAQGHDDIARLNEKLALFGSNEDGTVYVCVDLDTGAVYRTDNNKATPLTAAQFALTEQAGDRGVLEPFLDEHTGASMIGVYKRFSFADGTSGLVRKARPLSEMEDRFSLSFYNDSGFSYVVNSDGDVVMRSQHRDSNRTFSNLYDIVGFEGNDQAAVDSFRTALEQDARGVALFSYLGDEYVFCYTPLEGTAGWDVVSIIPNDVVMEQANAIINATLLLCLVIIVGLVVVLVVYWRSSRAHRIEIERMAYYDGLTGLFSADKFTLEGDARLAERSKGDAPEARVGGVAVAFVDIDNFKLINDVEGYAKGDEVLRELAVILREAVGPNGFAARLSADHFMLFYPYARREDALGTCGAAAERARSITGNGKPLALHIGLCCSEDAPEARDVTELTDRARIAQRESRTRGIVPCAYSQPMRDALLRRADLERTMESALEQGEFFYLIQPKYDVEGRRVLGGEALVRWRRPDEGIVGPDEFIPLFEQNGFILRLDEFVLESACRDLRARLDAGLPVVPLSVNVSRRHLHRDDFLPSYVRIKDRYGIPDGLCELELTESIVMDDLGGTFDIMEQMRAAGFRCAIDDFGSGYSSLNVLKSLPADVLKLDRGFLLEGTSPGTEETVVRTVITMAKDLRMDTVMEGVETPKQLAFLRTTPCDMVQGFVFSRPVAPEEFYRLLDTGK
ncbi:bifunctional diguanylate cyclase/phosphodiesterase [Gordonibacter massiliensis (ex Traore et al. 2017)]|uniref:bifunctional diguanylate cyclase/phosphodiesterase n=1 Tax=Gordonibacter massiliensis (ex Traore et al. 2017) TaxID=1841863 RepID=UPI001C8BD8B2|nr:EAL domain-containing protein [Gordonibacter massiliensis (ex Traore et al. 2017)]MBX9032984.1 EAL domain-containing protein [Gordonibacter massiliensis (ex Traore et al. 2017)]